MYTYHIYIYICIHILRVPFFGHIGPTIILLAWLKRDICRQEYWFAVSSLNVEAIHKDSCKQLTSDPKDSLGEQTFEMPGTETQPVCRAGGNLGQGQILDTKSRRYNGWGGEIYTYIHTIFESILFQAH